ncbi:indole-3-glycerol phosphate synthase TrpC [Athalassotoga saccharophila]|uniref:indole-3-glycerol phosphate synthase TrpC n=1 Tax=Athalassotoga saccharophila TaxID=1441386 RepID=UPI00137B1123|nr:indole-3-glycerol phosphate synthase TrpC [Athalassotoga saccharophila]BBJ28085.1 indole-3-glycerol phosphate synthase [Athalassotoga saccharophila]
MILDEIVNYKISLVEKKKKSMPLEKIKVTNGERRDFKSSISSSFSLIAEIKQSSPSKGFIRSVDPALQAQIYENSGVDAISVLTEDKYFNGEDRYVKIVKDSCTKPVLRKDFIVDTYQIFESLAIGSDAILLIVAILGKKLEEFYTLATSIGLYPLVEVHTYEEMRMALDCGCEIIGINNRNLKDFSVDLKTTERLMKYIDDKKIIVSESGIRDLEDIRYVKSLGVNAVLIGETLMRMYEDDVKKFVEEARKI